MNATDTIRESGRVAGADTPQVVSTVAVRRAVTELAALMVDGGHDDTATLEHLARLANRVALAHRRASAPEEWPPVGVMGAWSLDNGLLPAGGATGG